MLSDIPFGLIPAHLRGPQHRGGSAAESPPRPASGPEPAAAAAASAPAPAAASAPPEETASAPPKDDASDSAAGAPLNHAPRASRQSDKPPPAAPRSTDHDLNRERRRRVCDLLELHMMCHKSRCRRVGACRGDPARCLEAGLNAAPPAIGDLARRLMQEQRLGVNIHDAFEEALDDHDDAYGGWIDGLHAAYRG